MHLPLLRLSFGFLHETETFKIVFLEKKETFVDREICVKSSQCMTFFLFWELVTYFNNHLSNARTHFFTLRWSLAPVDTFKCTFPFDYFHGLAAPFNNTPRWDWLTMATMTKHWAAAGCRDERETETERNALSIQEERKKNQPDAATKKCIGQKITIKCKEKTAFSVFFS